MTSLPLIVIGGGIAGVTCAKTLSEDNRNLTVILITASSVVKTVQNLRQIGRSMDAFDVVEQNPETLETQNLKIKIGKVVKLDSYNKELFLENKEKLSYLKLCICTGAQPKVIQFDINANRYIKCIRDTQTVQDFQSILCNSKRILIVGNGGIACELVYEICNCEIIWVIKDKNFGTTFFDTASAKFFENYLNATSNNPKRIEPQSFNQCDSTKRENNEFEAALGPQWHCGYSMKGKSTKKVIIENLCQVKRVYTPEERADEQEKSNIYVELTNGKVYGCCLLLSATGVVPNSDIFAKDNQIELDTDKGILIDDEMRTNIVDVYAAGDVTSVNWRSSPNWFQMRLWTQARQMGFFSAKCIESHLSATSPAIYFNFEVFTHVTKFFGFRVILLGLYNGQKLGPINHKILLKVKPGESLIKVNVCDGKLRGAILIGDTGLEETFENLIYNQIDISSFGDHLLDNILDLEDYFD